MKPYKYFICITICLFTITFNNHVLADDENFENDINISNFIESSSDLITEPTINSRAAIVYDRNSGTILFGKNENEKRKMASTTKIMTAIVVLENCNLNEIVKISAKSAGIGGSRLGLHTNDTISVEHLLYGLLLCSGNDAAIALAEHVGGDIPTFANLMNKKCLELGLTSSHFVTPHGLDDDNHYTTAYELAIITNYALNNEVFCKFVSTKNYTITISNHAKTLSNTNELLGNLNGVYGVKTGFTNGANRCLVTSVKRGELNLICIVLGADTKKDRTKDSIELIEYAYNNFELINIKDKIQTEFENWKSCNYNNFNIEKGVSNNFDLVYDELPFNYIPINSHHINNISIYIYCNNYFQAPVDANSVVGYITINVDNKQIIKLNITNTNSVPQKTYIDFLAELIKNYVYHLESIFFH